MKQIVRFTIMTVALLVLGVSSAVAQTTSAFMLVPGIPGDSTQERHADWIDLVSVTQTFNGSGKGNACTVVVSKGVDRSGPLLWGAAAIGQAFTEIRIDIVKAGLQPQRFYELTLTNAFVSAINSSPTSLTEQVSLTGSSATLRYFPQNPDGSVGTPIASTVACK